MEKTLRVIFNLCRILMGITFVFSGFVKGVDPLGSAYKFSDYFLAAGLPPMEELSLVFSFLLSAAEFLIGVALITGIFMNFTAWVTICFMAFFTILTLILAIFNPVSDCGCFGDAVKLTNWETFFKNLIFSVIAVFILVYRKMFVFKSNALYQWAVVLFTVVMFFAYSVYSYKHLPIVDFMPYHVGADINAKMSIPAGAPQAEYQTVLIYKNKQTGKLQEFGMDNYPWQDTLTWQWADTKSKLISKGYEPPIHDFSITSSDGDNVTAEILNFPGTVYLFIAYNIKHANSSALTFGEKLYQYCLADGNNRFYAISASTKSEIQKIESELNLSYPFYSADETAMKTVIRSNPGVVVLKNGIVTGKYHFNDFNKILPAPENEFAVSIDKQRNIADWGISLTLLFALAFVLALAWALFLFYKNNKQ